MKRNFYCILNDEIYTHLRDILLGKSQSEDEVSLALSSSNERLIEIEEVLKQAPHILSRVPGNAMYTLTPEGFIEGVQKGL